MHLTFETYIFNQIKICTPEATTQMIEFIVISPQLIVPHAQVMIARAKQIIVKTVLVTSTATRPIFNPSLLLILS